MRSLINGKEYGGTTYLVTLLVQGSGINQHASIIIEGEKINDNDKGECWYLTCDFIPKDHNKNGGPKPGVVRCRGSISFFNPEKNACYDYVTFGKLEEGNCPFEYRGRGQIEEKFSLKKGDKYHSWKVNDVNTIKQLLIDIANDSRAENLQYEQCGSSSIAKSRLNSHNCITWAKKILRNCSLRTQGSYVSFIAELVIAIPGLYTSETIGQEAGAEADAIRRANLEIRNTPTTSVTAAAAATTAAAAASSTVLSASLSYTLLKPPAVAASSSTVLPDEQIDINVAITRSEEDAKRKSSNTSRSRVSPR